MAIIENEWNPEQYQQNAGFVANTFGTDLFAQLNAKRGQRILDFGCGDGLLTLEIAKTGADVVGIDYSAEMIGKAKEQSKNTIPSVMFHQMDGTKLTLDKSFDVVFSNAALHWMKPFSKAIEQVHSVLKPTGGRFLAECGGQGNVSCIIQACVEVLESYGVDGQAQIPWTFPSVDQCRSILQDTGFTVHEIKLSKKPTVLPKGIRGWLETFADSFFLAVEESQRSKALDAVVARLTPALQNENGDYVADYVRLRFDCVC